MTGSSGEWRGASGAPIDSRSECPASLAPLLGGGEKVARLRSFSYWLTNDPRKIKMHGPFVLAAIVLCGSLGIAHACNVPVFRFALERWRPDPYSMTVFHREPLTDADRSLLDAIDKQRDQSAINLVVRTVEVSQLEVRDLDDADRELFASVEPARLPAFVVQYPMTSQNAAPIWSSSLTADSVARLTQSPIRTELVRRLAAGQTAVWLLLESGQEEKDDAAAVLLQKQLQKLESELKLPELTDSPEDKLLAATPLRVGFSLLRVPHREAEQPLIQTLLHSEADLAERSDPIVFPVFGRGRALWPLVGAGITEDNIRDSATFLVGSCSCEVKESNPGFDLLLSADWSELLAQDGQPLLASQTRHASPPGDGELVPIPRGSSRADEAVPVPESEPASRQWVIAGLMIGGAALIVALRVAVSSRTSRKGLSGPIGPSEG